MSSFTDEVERARIRAAEQRVLEEVKKKGLLTALEGMIRAPKSEIPQRRTDRDATDTEWPDALEDSEQ